MKKNRFFKSLALALAFNAAASAPVAASPSRPAPRTDNHAYIVINAEDGRVLAEQDSAQRLYPASTTKVMTAYLVFKALQEGTLKMDAMLTVSANAASKERTNLDLKAGMKISVANALTGMIVHSGNDAAVVLAEAIGGSEAGFARMMNSTAKELGMTRTNFANPNGLPNPNHKTTVADMATLCRALIRDYPDGYAFFSRKTFTYRGTVYTSYNRLLNTYPDLDGIKTGWTIASGSNLAASAKRGDTRIIGVIFGARNAEARNNEMTRLLDTGFRIAAATPRAAHVLSPVVGATGAPPVPEVPEPQAQTPVKAARESTPAALVPAAPSQLLPPSPRL